MKRIGIPFFLVSTFFTVCCGGSTLEVQDLEIVPPRHRLIGKWTSKINNNLSSTYHVEFRDNGFVRIEQITPAGSVNVEYSNFEIGSDKLVSFRFGLGATGKPITVFASTIDDLKLEIDCYYNGNMETPVYTDPPMFCMENRLVKSH